MIDRFVALASAEMIRRRNSQAPSKLSPREAQYIELPAEQPVSNLQTTPSINRLELATIRAGILATSLGIPAIIGSIGFITGNIELSQSYKILALDVAAWSSISIFTAYDVERRAQTNQ